MIKNTVRPTYTKAIKIYDIEIFKQVDVTMEVMIERKLLENNPLNMNTENEYNL